MSLSDLRLRESAVPYYANVWGYNRNAQSDVDISQSDGQGDLAPLIGQFGSPIYPQTPVRIMRPYYGSITQAYLTMQLTLGTNQPSAVNIWIGRGTTRSIGHPTEAAPEVSEDILKADHAKLGLTSPYTVSAGQTLLIKRLNLMPIIANTEAENFPYVAPRPYDFILQFLFSQPIVVNVDGNFNITNGYKLRQFKIECSAQIRGVAR